MKRLSKLGLVLGAASAVAFASPAAATTVCAGTQNTAGVCVDVTKSTLYQDCVYVGPPPCIPVSVPGVAVGCWGWIGPNTYFVCT